MAGTQAPRSGFARVEIEYLYCPLCASDAEFETPPCPDGHGNECPERACTACGIVVSVANTPLATVA